uniref:Protein kinase domain-containing protein n=1 Tax=Panagrellus redivivus TaxID=6233 RepID=A0A7E4UYS2_PANRE
MKQPSFVSYVNYGRAEPDEILEDIVRDFALSTLGLAQFDKAMRYPLINQIRVDKQILDEPPSIKVFRAHYTFSNDPKHKIYNIQLKETRLIAAAELTRERAELKELLQGKAMELYALHYLEHKNIMKALWTDLSDPDMGLYVTVTKPYVTVRKMMKKSHDHYFHNPVRYHFAVHADQVIHRDVIGYICYEVCKALYYLHSKEIYHNNVTADSVYIDRDGNVVLGDFDKAEYVPRMQNDIEYHKDVQGLAILHVHLFHPQAVFNYEKKAGQKVTPVDHRDIYASVIDAIQPYVHSEKFRENTVNERELWACILMNLGMVRVERLLTSDLFIPPQIGYYKVKRTLMGHMKEVKAWPKPHVEKPGLLERTSHGRKPESKIKPEYKKMEVKFGPPPQLEITTYFTFKAHDGSVLFREKLVFKNTEEHKLLHFLKGFEQMEDPTHPPERYGFGGRQPALLPWEVLTVRKNFDLCMDDLLLGAETSSAVVKIEMGTIEMGLVIPDIRR